MQLPLQVSSYFSDGRWTAEVRLITPTPGQGEAGYTLWTYTEPHDVANGPTDLTEKVRERAVGQFANRLARLLTAPDTTATDG